MDHELHKIIVKLSQQQTCLECLMNKRKALFRPDWEETLIELEILIGKISELEVSDETV